MKMMIQEKYEEQIAGIIQCYDRINIRCRIGIFGYKGGMDSFFYQINRKHFDFVKVFEPVTETIRANIENIAKENGMEIEFVRKVKEFRKEEKISEIVSERGTHEGLVKIYSQLETCNTYKPWYDKKTGNTSFEYATTKALHYYIYFIDKLLGLCFIKICTAAPFSSKLYFNGHGLLETKLQKENIAYQRVENAFTYIANYERAQELSDKIRVEDIHEVCDILMNRYCPLPEEWGLTWNYTIEQVEYAMDVIWKEQGELK